MTLLPSARLTAFFLPVLVVACGGATGSAGPADAGASDVTTSGDAADTGPIGSTDASDAPANPCSGKTCGESCHSWRVNAEACDISGVCNEANYAGCSCDPCSAGCLYLGLCEAGAGNDSSASACAFVDTLDRSCTSDTDCAFGAHQTDCCGSTTAIGLRATESVRFAALEASCDQTYPACGCAPGPARTDSGETTIDRTTIQVGCISAGPARTCRTYVTTRPPDAP